MLILFSVAHAQPLFIGDFESGALGPWTASGDPAAEVMVVQEGTSFSAVTDTTTLDLPGAWSLLLRMDAAFGTPMEDTAVATSAPFVVTHTLLQAEHWIDDPDVSMLAEANHLDGTRIGSTAGANAPGVWTAVELDLDSVCAADATVRFLSADALDQGGVGLSLIDDVRLAGDPCPQLVDTDGDGLCTDGLDLDGDGRCADAAEVRAGSDCGEGDPATYPGAPEVPGDGIDQDCDGADTPGPRSLAGHVLEDPDGTADVSAGVGLEGVVVQVWLDGGDGDDVTDGEELANG